jgi:hypothetical protein
VLLLVVGSPSLSSAQEGCRSIGFPKGKSGIVLTGQAPAGDVISYRQDAEVGERFTLKVLHGANTIFSVVDVRDADDHLTFTAQKTGYQVNVRQLMRAAKPETFRISIKRSKSVR